MSLGRRIAPAAASGLVIGIWAWLAFIYLPGGVYWTPDVGLKRIQAANIRPAGGLDLTIAYPGQRLDPDLRFVPFRANFYYLWRGQIHFAQPPIIAVLSAPFIALFNYHGEPVAAWLAGLIAVGLTGLLTIRVGRGPGWPGLLLAGLATPLVVYGVFMWEHTLGVALALGSVAVSLDEGERRLPLGRAALGGLLAGLAGCVRKELFLFALLFAVYQALPLQNWRDARHRARCALWLGAFSLPVLAWWGFAYLNSGQVLPPEFRVSLTPSPTPAAYASRVGPGALADFVFDPRYGWLGDGLLLAVAAYWLAASARAARLTRAWLPDVVQGPALAALLISAWRMAPAAMTSVCVFGLLSASPFLVLGLAPGPDAPPRAHVMRNLLLAYYALTILALGFGTEAGPLQSGLEWGTRYGLLAFALGVPLCASALRALWRRARQPQSWLARGHLALALALVAWSAVWQFTGVSLMRRPAVPVEVRDALLEQSSGSDAVLTNLWWLSSAAPDLYLTRPLFLVESDDALGAWLAAAQRGGVRRFEYVSYVPFNLGAAAAHGPPDIYLQALGVQQLPNQMLVTDIALTPAD